MFIRLNDGSTFVNDDFQPYEIKKRKGNSAKQFAYKSGEFNKIKFKTEELEFKMIPKSEMEFINGKFPLKVILTELGNSIVFQDITGAICTFHLDDNDDVLKINCNELVEGMTLVLHDEDGIIFDDIKEIHEIYSESVELESDEDGEEINHLGNYILNTNDKGILVNKFMLV